MFISILGRQPGISLAELEILFGADKITKLSDVAAVVDAPAPSVDRLGGSIKIISNVHKLDSSNWRQAFNEVTKYLKNHARNHGSGKMVVGLSVYGDTSVRPKHIQKYLIETKKEMRASGFSVRVIPNKEIILNSAQVLHNKLTLEKNVEVVLVKSSGKYWIGRTNGVQNIEALSKRDQGRPKRDAHVGMLPPKLALIMINLSGLEQQSGAPKTVLDPFCGTGVILQESLIAGHHAFGTDLEQRMIDYTKINLDWVKEELSLTNTVRLEQGDAQYHKWPKPFDTVVSETYLGPPMSSSPSPDKLAIVRSEVNSLLETFLRNLHMQLEEGATVCIAVPAWRVGRTMLHLNLLDDLEKLGYTRLVLKHATYSDLVYIRPEQTVARELLILKGNPKDV